MAINTQHVYICCVYKGGDVLISFKPQWKAHADMAQIKTAFMDVDCSMFCSINHIQQHNCFRTLPSKATFPEYRGLEICILEQEVCLLLKDRYN